ncbi:MAG: hypothetical protein GX096_01430 [Clostridiales bacterium]|nr:hypothetical protein [Clostridiales bacterium]
MKKLISLFLCVLLMLTTLSAGALASESKNQNVVIGNPDTNINTDSIIANASTKDTLYLLVYQIYENTVDLHYWRDGMETSEKMDTDTFTWYENDEKGEPLETNITDLFTEGEAVYALNQATMSVRKLIDESGAAISPSEVLYTIGTPIDTDAGEQRDEFINSICASEGVLYVCKVLYGGNTTRKICMYDIATGEELGELEENDMQYVFPYKDGKMLMITFDMENGYDEETGEMRPCELVILDPKTKAKESVGEIDYNAASAVYVESSNTIFYVDGSKVMSLPNMTGPAKLSAYMPVQSWNNNNQAMLNDNLFVIIQDNMIYAREMDDPALQDGVLTVSGDSYSSSHRAFVQNHPEIDIEFNNDLSTEDFTSLANAMVSGEDSLDIISINGEYSPLARIIDKGYAADLSAYPEIMDVISTMDPSLTSCLMRDGKLYGIPIGLDGNGLGYMPETLEAVGMTEDDLPTTFVQLLEFFANWQYDYGEDHPEITLIGELDMKSVIMSSMMSTYMDVQLRDSETVAFDTPLFRKLMAAFEQIDFTELDPYEQYGEDIWNDNDAVNEIYSKDALFVNYGNYTSPSSFGPDNYCTIMALPLDEGIAPLLAVSPTVLIVNPRTTRMDQAVIYLSEYMKHYDYYVSYALFPDNNEPMANLTYEMQVKTMQDELEKLKIQLENAEPERKAGIQETIGYYEDSLAHSDNWKMTVSEEQLTRFREVATPYYFTKLQTPLTNYAGGAASDLNTIIQQYLQKAIDSDTLIREFDNRLRMMMLEDQ